MIINYKKMSMKNVSDFNIESAKDFIEKYLSQIIYIICFVLVIVFFAIFLSNRKEIKKTELTAKYYQAVNYLNSNNEEEAVNLLNSIYTSKYATADIKSMVALKLADLSVSNDEIDKAIEFYMAVYNIKNNDIFLRNLSGLSALNLMINKNDNSNNDTIKNLIVKMSSPDNPLLLLVNEQEAMFKIQNGDIQGGLEILNNLLKEDIDENMRQRVKSIIVLYENI